MRYKALWIENDKNIVTFNYVQATAITKDTKKEIISQENLVQPRKKTVLQFIEIWYQSS